jgi:predicted acylesterase/phospholipase RssA
MAIGLALSGGGFRASLFHLGVIRRLRAEGRLDELSCIASVSGGSVTAAHLIANWKDYNSCPEDFDRVAKELISFTKFDARGRILRRLPLLWIVALIPFLPNRWRVSPTDLLAKYYDKHLFHGAHAAEVGGPKTFLILSTNLSQAELTCFGRDSVLYIPFNDQTERAPIDAKIIPLAKVVTASSAFPGFFPPIILSDSDLGADEGSIPEQYFTDAGIYDNLGLYGLRKGAPASLDRVLVSDAGRSFVPPKAIVFGMLSTALRAIDIFMFRIRQSDLTWSTAGLPVIMISISDEARIAGASAPAIQSQLENIRTDLDRFSQLEITELMRHGYYITAKALASDRGELEPPAIPKWDIPAEPWVKTTAPHTVALALKKSARRRWRLFSVRDWISLAHFAIIALVVVSLIELSDIISDKTNSFIAGIKAYSLTKNDPQWTDAPTVPIETVANLEETKNPGFQILNDDRVWDLRQLKARPSAGGLEVTGPTLLLRSSTLIRLDPSATQYRYRYQTAATEFAAWSPNQAVKVKLLRSEKTTQSGVNILNTYELQLDVSYADLNKQFVLQAESKAINAPWDRNNSWLGMRITDDVPEATLRIIFPESLPYQRPAFQSYPNDSLLEARTSDGILVNRAEKELIWTIDHPQKGWTYRIQWDWR